MISDRSVGVVIGILLLCAFSMPFIYLIDPNDEDILRTLNLAYDYTELVEINGSLFTDVSRVDTLEYVVTFSNMRALLHTQYYTGFPLAIDSSSWSMDDIVIIDSYSAHVVNYDNLQGYDCWICEIDTGNISLVSYDSVSGILVQLEWVELHSVTLIELQEMTYTSPQKAIRDEGILLSAIFIELAVIVFLLYDRHRKSS